MTDSYSVCSISNFSSKGFIFKYNIISQKFLIISFRFLSGSVSSTIYDAVVVVVDGVVVEVVVVDVEVLLVVVVGVVVVGVVGVVGVDVDVLDVLVDDSAQNLIIYN